MEPRRARCFALVGGSAGDDAGVRFRPGCGPWRRALKNGSTRMRATNLAPAETPLGRDAGERPVRTTVLRITAPEPRAEAQPERVRTLVDRLAREIGATQFERYFGAQAQLAISGGKLLVTVPSGYLSELLTRRFGTQLQDVARTAALQLEVRVDRSSFEAPRQPPNAPAPSARATPIFRPQEVNRHRFDTFILGRSNRLAYSACLRVAEDDTPAPPIFLHGTCGLGKTHLLRACAARFQERRPGSSVKYTTAEAFTNEFIQAVRNGRVDQFRRIYRRVDLLCIDDVHFFTSKDATQTELLHTLDAVTIDNSRLVLASDEHPKEIARLSERLVSRFMAGAVVKVEMPEPELRAKLVKHLSERRGLHLEPAAIELIAERSGRSVGSLGGFGGSVREIEGLLNQVDAVARLLPEFGQRDGKIGVVLVRKALGLDDEAAPHGAPSAPRLRKPITAEIIVGEICRELAVDIADFMGKGRHKRVVLARSLVSSISRRLTTMSFPEIARSMGRTNHSTIITAQKRLDRQVAEDAGRPLNSEVAAGYAGCTLRELYDGLLKKLQRG